MLIYEEKKRVGWKYVEFSGSADHFTIYVDSFYLITTTITTVGYGDFKGFYDNEGDWLIEMIFLSVAMVTGIILFTTVVN